MSWLGHENSEMVRYYYHLYDAEAQRRMQSIPFLGNLQGVPPGSSDAGSQVAEDEECARGA
jgi:hypothetical protein